MKRKIVPVEKLKVSGNLDYLYKKVAPSLPDQYALAKQSGFTHVEGGMIFKYPLSEVKAAKEKAGVEQVMMNMADDYLTKGEIGWAAIPGKEKQFCEDLDRLVEYAKALNCKLVHVLAGKVEKPTPENHEVFMKNLRYALCIFEKEDLYGLVEAINWVVEPGYYLDTFEKAIDVIKEINSPRLKLLLDIYHLQYCSGNLTRNLQWLVPYTGHMQISQIPGRHEPGSMGEMNYDFIFKLLKELGYSGWIGLEYVPAGDIDEGLEWVAKQGVIGYERPEKKSS